MRFAPHPDALPVDQLCISGNACGPAALLASYRNGNDAWQGAEAKLPGDSDRDQLRGWIRRYGLRPSTTLGGRMRWSRSGINVEDLAAAANETSQSLYLPRLAHGDLFQRTGESPAALLKRTRSCLEKSLAKGIPPILSLRRYVFRQGTWMPIQGHFVTVTGAPRGIGPGESSFPIQYLDPIGGKSCQGLVRISDQSLLRQPGEPSACLEAVVPASRFGIKEVRSGEISVVVPAAVIGRW
ncbi:hypothetical protein [Luteolibacter marinus]|uniref:hypothetical protein n=1 Tax=Luteolibacter marinus TaxID=2776705 RepID=UPI001868BD0E|nr:hypothetical protein [Luteolibacter marinus]